MSNIGVPFIISAPETKRTSPRSRVCSIPSSFTQLSPKEFGRKGERVANTPKRVFPPRRGGLTVGLNFLPSDSENCQMSQRWLNCSMPLRASFARNSGSNTIFETAEQSPLCRGMPNFDVKPFSILAMISSSVKAASQKADFSYNIIFRCILQQYSAEIIKPQAEKS